MHFMAIKKSRKLSGLVVYSYSKKDKESTAVWWPTTAIRQKRHKFVNLRLNFNYFALKIKRK